MARPVWFVRLIQATFPQRHIVARLTRVPVVGRLLDRWLFEDDDLFYLPKSQVLAIHQPVEQAGEMALPYAAVEHFIQQASHHWIMNECICREAEQCTDYPRDLGCLFLGEPVLGINPKLGRVVSKEEALEHARRCREAGLVHLIGRNKLDTAWLGVGPGRKLLTICNCCPCCCLWRILPQVAPSIGSKVAAMPGVRVTVTDRCVGCGTCSQGVCFVNAIQLSHGRAVISSACRACGRCADVCPEKAIKVTMDEGATASLIERLSSSVDVT